jgi:gp69 protein
MRDIRKRGWFWIENELIDRTDLSFEVKSMYMILARFADNEGKCFPSVEKLAEIIGKDKRTVIRYIKKLEEKGLIEKRRRFNQTNIYYLKNADSNSDKIDNDKNDSDKDVTSLGDTGVTYNSDKNVNLKRPIEKDPIKNTYDVVNKNIDTKQQKNNITQKSESNNEHQTYVLDLAKTEMMKLCKNQITVDTALITHRHKIQSLYKFLGKDKFLETFEKIQESTYLQEQSKNAGQFFNWLFSSKKENFLSVFNDVYIDKSKAVTENETTSDYSQLSEKDFDMDSMWEERNDI